MIPCVSLIRADEMNGRSNHVAPEAPDAGLRPCARTRGKPRPVFLSRSPFPPRSGANGSRHAESAPRVGTKLAHSLFPASAEWTDRAAASAWMHCRAVLPPTVGVGCPAKSRERTHPDENSEIVAQASSAETRKPRGHRLRSAAHHWWRSAVSQAENDRARPSHNHAAPFDTLGYSGPAPPSAAGAKGRCANSLRVPTPSGASGARAHGGRLARNSRGKTPPWVFPR